MFNHCHASATNRPADCVTSTPLHIAISRRRSYPLTRLLLDCGADLENRNIGQETTLHTFFNDALSRVLLSHDHGYSIIDPTSQDSRGMTLLHFVAWSSKSTPALIQSLINCGGPSAALLRDFSGRSIVHFAAQRGNTALLRHLFPDSDGSGVNLDLDERDCCGKSALHYAIESKRTETIDILVSRGADIRAVDCNGRTPLHHAAARGNLHAVMKVVGIGGREMVEMMDAQGKTPERFATRGDVIEYLARICEVEGGDCLAVDKTDNCCGGPGDGSLERLQIEHRWVPDNQIYGFLMFGCLLALWIFWSV